MSEFGEKLHKELLKTIGQKNCLALAQCMHRVSVDHPSGEEVDVSIFVKGNHDLGVRFVIASLVCASLKRDARTTMSSRYDEPRDTALPIHVWRSGRGASDTGISDLNTKALHAEAHLDMSIHLEKPREMRLNVTAWDLAEPTVAFDWMVRNLGESRSIMY